MSLHIHNSRLMQRTLLATGLLSCATCLVGDTDLASTETGASGMQRRSSVVSFLGAECSHQESTTQQPTASQMVLWVAHLPLQRLR